MSKEKEFYCPVYRGKITQYDCDEIQLINTSNDGLPFLIERKTIIERYGDCLKCERNKRYDPMWNGGELMTDAGGSLMDKYWYCSVKVKGVHTAYSYISDMGELACGTYVEVSFGKQNVLRIGTVESCGEYSEDCVPFPVDKTKHIIRISSKDEYDNEETIVPYYETPDKEEISEVNYYIEEEDWDEVLEWAIMNHDCPNEKIMQKVIECYKLCVKQNIPVAALNLGTFYYKGRGVPQNYEKAFELYSIAADAGELRAICNIAYCYYYGREREIDYAKAYKYFSLGAMLYNDANCIYKLGDMYLNGYQVEKNEQYAYLLYNRALSRAKENESDEDCLADTQFRVGKCLLHRIGVAYNPEKALSLLLAALQGFYKRRKTDPFVGGLIFSTKELISEAEKVLDSEIMK